MSQRGFGDADSMFNRADLLLGDFLQDVAMQLMPPLVADFATGFRQLFRLRFPSCRL